MRLFLSSLFTLLLVVLLSACETTSPYSAMRGSRHRAADIKPVVAVVAFDDLTGNSMDRALGERMADAFMIELMETDRFVVSQRKSLNDFLAGLLQQGKDFFRENSGPKKNVQEPEYLVRGTITDFSVSGRKHSGLLGFLRRGGKTKLAVTLRVTDVRTGQLISNIRLEESVRSGKYESDKEYRGMRVGSDAFSATPLGRATERAIKKGAAKVVGVVPRQSWDLRIAATQVDTVVINGGKNRKVRRGDEFIVRGEARYVTDPNTGNVIDQVQGPISGKIRVTLVKDQSAHATILSGEAQRGDRLEPAS